MSANTPTSWGLAEMGCRQPEGGGRGPVEAGDCEVAADHDDGKIDCVENADQVGRLRRCAGVAISGGLPNPPSVPDKGSVIALTPPTRHTAHGSLPHGVRDRR